MSNREAIDKNYRIFIIRWDYRIKYVIGCPVFTRLHMGVLKHRFVWLQDGASAVIINDKDQILLQSRADHNKWGLPGGC